MNGLRLRRRTIRMPRRPAPLVSAATAAAGFLLVTTVLVPELVIGKEVLPDSWSTVIELGVVFALAALLMRRPSVMERGVNRVFAHGMLAALVVVAFTGAIAGVTTLIYQGGVGVALIAAALVVLTALPLRAYVSQRTDAILFGELDEPYHVITGLGRHLETTAPPDEVLPGVVDTVADALRLPYVAIELESATGTVLAASTGNLDGPATRLPLTYQGERVGWLVLGTRAPGEHLTVADRKLLEDLARQIGVAARAVQLMHDLRRSHTLLVAAREEERKRLRRDLHDGLGPMLAGIDLASQAARNLLRRDPYAADAVLARVVTESRAATAEVRRLVDNLRPLALDRLGLVDALREQILSISAGEGTPDDGLVVVIEASPDLRSLPPAVETAAYRIALEAFVNVRRHANARSCTIRLTRGASLHLAVIDDGDGFFAGACPGVGIASMQERAAELGGTCTVARGEQGGTEVHALLPAALTVSALPTL